MIALHGVWGGSMRCIMHHDDHDDDDACMMTVIPRRRNANRGYCYSYCYIANVKNKNEGSLDATGKKIVTVGLDSTVTPTDCECFTSPGNHCYYDAQQLEMSLIEHHRSR
jgi:hypothetical protein